MRDFGPVHVHSVRRVVLEISDIPTDLSLDIQGHGTPCELCSLVHEGCEDNQVEVHVGVVHDLGFEKDLGGVVHDLVAKLGLSNILSQLVASSLSLSGSIFVSNLVTFIFGSFVFEFSNKLLDDFKFTSL